MYILKLKRSSTCTKDRRIPDCFMMSATSRQASSLADIFLHACTLLSYSTGRRSISAINCASMLSSSPGRRRRRLFCRRAMVIEYDRLWSVVRSSSWHLTAAATTVSFYVVRPNDARTTCAGLCYCRDGGRGSSSRQRRRRRRRRPRARRQRRR